MPILAGTQNLSHLSGGIYTFEFDLGVFQNDDEIAAGAIGFYGPFQEKKQKENQGSEQNGDGSQKQEDNSSSDNNASDNTNVNESNSNTGDNNTSPVEENQDDESVGSTVDSDVGYFPPVSTTDPATTETVEIEEDEVALGSGNGEGNDSGLKGTGDSLPYTGNLPNEVLYILGALLLVGGILIKAVRAR